MAMLDRVLRRDEGATMDHINQAAAIVEAGISGGMLRAELLIDAIAAALAERDRAAASLDASNQEIIDILKVLAGLPAGVAVTRALMSKEEKSHA